MNHAKIAAAEALWPLLDTFQALSGHPLRRARHFYDAASLNAVVLDFGNLFLTVTTEKDDDTIEFSVGSADCEVNKSIDVSNAPPWASFMGAPFGWGWVTVNQQGYTDGLIMSFGGIVPQIMLSVMASSIKESTIKELSTKAE